ncbi:type I-E CRISPR-associated protein Cse2/CasB [Streptomyces sp. SID4946]|uniref:type I-E CRISPR-associated protein Cse2/CasB n=1 Tax=Streptomyces sp. LamerLS-31b TaxID=1839765 RepID=UPI00081EDDEE|nr:MULTISPECIES: type I-E CRISPR-associated protein Cse2/CasB [unclassified Streptomyces]MYQ95418.1 type I-E CRISPR-associated protein Cse2/CasB [Streptomyces sp. SID4946]SCF75959.1 CRISPR type I-E/ECOLI-associated protein CasB/Cse2 [Streptomyces sp. LamerLS-31b]SCF95438.1 CRISPR type I-E/ECOLI-associated protein CasB/Cse2 [Streptomyces sp. DconLS]
MTTSSTVSVRSAADPTRLFFWEEVVQDWQTGREQERHSAFSEYIARNLRALREGAAQEAGTVPSMRSVHRVPMRDDSVERLPGQYIAEHHTLTLFGLHQHAASEPVHRPGTGLGTACLLLRHSGALTQAAVERRLIAAATAQDLHELVQHLQRLVPLLRQAGVGLDYTRLFRELARWDEPDRNQVLRSWGLQYTDPGTPAEADGERAAKERAPYWVAFDPGAPDAGAELAALRSGAGREPGTVAAMWAFHRTRMASEWRNKGSLTRDLSAEHNVLTLFARHQQTHSRPMHIAGNSPGTAAGLLARKAAVESEGRAGTAALERRFGVLLTSADADELAMHLRSFIPLLSQAGVGLDYNLLRTALRTWDDPRRPDAATGWRQRWDRDFHVAATS